jgi:hypothetical protein
MFPSVTQLTLKVDVYGQRAALQPYSRWLWSSR